MPKVLSNTVSQNPFPPVDSSNVEARRAQIGAGRGKKLPLIKYQCITIMGYYWPADVFSDDVVMIKTFGAGMSKISESTTLAP